MARAWKAPAALAVLLAVGTSADWPTLRGNVRRSGWVAEALAPSYRLSWLREFPGDRLGTAMEPIVAAGSVFLATHQGHVCALDATNGAPRWRFRARGAFLHSPCVADGLVLAASTDGWLYALAVDTGTLRWRQDLGEGGAAASPAVHEDRVFLGTRGGQFLAIALADGAVLWRRVLPAPVRQTATVDQGGSPGGGLDTWCSDSARAPEAGGEVRVLVTAEDLRMRCYDVTTGRLVWISPAVPGQSARDVYPVIVKSGHRSVAVVRTSPARNMAQQIGRDRGVLAQSAGFDGGSWPAMDAWLKGGALSGGRTEREQEQQAIVDYLERDPWARTFFAFDVGTGEALPPPPILWVGGCQGVPAPPVTPPGGRGLTLFRTAHGNWSLGVAPLVGLGLLDLERNRVERLTHAHGTQPPWNTFWGTADEAQNLVVCRDEALIVHQGTLSRFHLQTRELRAVWGARDTFGGFLNPHWALNEWHGPARGGVAVSVGRIFWLTGSRLLCFEPGGPGEAPAPVAVQLAEVSGTDAPAVPAPSPARLAAELDRVVDELLAAPWAPLYVEPGLAGREFFFADPADRFEALAWAYPHLPPATQQRVKRALAEEWSKRPPLPGADDLPLDQGNRRERFAVAAEELTRTGPGGAPPAFSRLAGVWRYATRCGEEARVEAGWADWRAAFARFEASGWTLDPARGDLHANRILAALLAFETLARRQGDAAAAAAAHALADRTTTALIAWWQRAAGELRAWSFDGSRELDPFIQRGNALFLAVAPHRHKLALFRDLTPEVAARVKRVAPEAVAQVWADFAAVCPTWHLAGEERQVHTGENYLDPPDFAASAFRAATFLGLLSGDELAARVDLPFCRADLCHLERVAMVIERTAAAKADRPIPASGGTSRSLRGKGVGEGSKAP